MPIILVDGDVCDVGQHYQNVVSQRYGVLKPKLLLQTLAIRLLVCCFTMFVKLTKTAKSLSYILTRWLVCKNLPSGWPCVIARRGFFQYSGSALTPVGQGESLYVSPAGDGGLSTGSVGTTATAVAKAYGPTDSNGYTYVFVNVT